MDSSPLAPPSIMGSENAKFTERRQDLSDTENSESQKHDSAGNEARHSRDGLTRDERMRLVRARQMEEHIRRMDELRQHQIQAMKAKKQLCEERQKKLDDIKYREDQRRSAVEARRKRLDEEERSRREAILRKHHEIFERIEEKRRRHESRKVAFGLASSGSVGINTSSRLSDQDSVYTSPRSRRAISAGALSSRSRHNKYLTARSYHQSSNIISPGSRGHPSPGTTPSRSGGFLESMSVSGSASKGTSSDNSPVHSGRQNHRQVQMRIPTSRSHPPPVMRNRLVLTTTTAGPSAKSRQGQGQQPQPQISSRPRSAKVEQALVVSSRAARPTSLMTRSYRLEGKKSVVVDGAASDSNSNGMSTFKIISKRSQSVGNVSARNQKNRNGKSDDDSAKLMTTSSSRHIDLISPTHTGLGQGGSDAIDSGDGVRSRKITSEAEAKAALAEKRRQARLKAHTQPTITSRQTDESHVKDSVSGNQSDSPVPPENNEPAPPKEVVVVREKSPQKEQSNLPDRRNSLFTLDDFQKTEEEMAKNATETLQKKADDTATAAAGETLEESVVTREVSSDEEQSDLILTYAKSEIVRDAEESQIKQKILPVMEEITCISLVTSEFSEERVVDGSFQPEASGGLQVDWPVAVSGGSPTSFAVQSSPVVTVSQSAEFIAARKELERRRLELEQKEDEERLQRRLRLDAIRNLTKGEANLTGSTERLSSPVTESKPMDALENARKLLSRKKLGGGSDTEPATPVSETSAVAVGDMQTTVRSFSGVALAEPKDNPSADVGKSVGSDKRSVNGSLLVEESLSFDPYQMDFSSASWSIPSGNVVDSTPSSLLNGSGNAQLLLNFDDAS